VSLLTWFLFSACQSILFALFFSKPTNLRKKKEEKEGCIQKSKKDEQHTQPVCLSQKKDSHGSMHPPSDGGRMAALLPFLHAVAAANTVPFLLLLLLLPL